ncbi:hypothetical protein E2I00_011073 [Balaenoptera physalus]|uniref:Cadherin domain-containing protein n=1 Tax=Balaenoptera physalus TaxID=9770 RepID=A0A6A1Q6Q7_BALPH|nr:hypothetical protein E2I00_011073 [Balaenoptera physalus]
MSHWRLRFPTDTLHRAGLGSLLLLLLLLVSGSCTETVNFLTYEEEALGTSIGVLSDHILFNSQREVPGQFCLIKFNSSLIQMQEGDGQLTVGDAGLDLERLCGQAFDVVSFWQERFRLVHVEVEVKDINHHAPRFPRAQIPVEVSEGAVVGTRIPLEVPVDEDVGANGLQSVRLAEPHSPFRVELQTRADGAQCADLVLLQELDRESQAAYNLELVAQDGGRPPRSATAALSVRAGAISLVPEGTARESLVALVSTSDRDSGANGQVRCALYGHEHFRLQPAYAGSYLVVTAGSLDRERIAEYNLTLVAEDRGAPPLRTVRPYLVRDQNDHAPRLVTPPLVSDSAQAPLPRDAPLGYLLTRLQARDADQDLNAELTYIQLRSDCGPGALALHPATGELSLQCRLSPQPADPLTAAVVCTATLLLVPAHSAPPGGEVVVVPRPPPPANQEREGPAGRRTAHGAGRHPDLSVVVVGVLTGGCGLPLVAIVTVTCSCSGKARTRRKRLCEHRQSGCHASSGQACPCCRTSAADPGSFDPRFFVETPPLSISSEAQGNESSFHSPFLCGEDKSAASLRTHSNPDEFSVRDSGKGDSELNDNSSDIRRERQQF